MTLMMTMPCKFTVGLSLAHFVAVLAVAPLLTPARHELAAKINDQTLKLAAAIKSARNEPLPRNQLAPASRQTAVLLINSRRCRRGSVRMEVGF